MLRFSEANAKTEGISEWSSIENPKIYSMSIISGYTCPGAKECQAWVIEDKETGKRKVLRGKDANITCFSVSQEAQYTSVYNQRKHNFDLLSKHRYNSNAMFGLIYNSIPKDANYIRVHVGGDFFTSEYMLAWYSVARFHSDITFYAYTKSIQFQIDNEPYRPDNFHINSSEGGKQDSLIHEFGLKSFDVVLHPSKTTRPIDHNEYYALHNEGSASFLVHGTQEAGSEASKAQSEMKKQNIPFSYNRK